MKVDNAIIMAAGLSSRFAPLSYETHKALVEVRGEILIERQIRQLKGAGIRNIIIVTGYKADQFNYLIDKYGVKLIHNGDFLNRNNNGSIWAVRNELGNSYICSADNYFTENPFNIEEVFSYYSAEFAEGETGEWCMTEDENGFINSVVVGGEKSWYMLGHVFWSKEFSERFINILEREYNYPETKGKLWENIFIEHLDELKMRIKKFPPGVINEFDTLDELRLFDNSYFQNTRSSIIKSISKDLEVSEDMITDIKACKTAGNDAIGFDFCCNGIQYRYLYDTCELSVLDRK